MLNNFSNFVPSQRSIARNVPEVFSYNRVVHPVAPSEALVVLYQAMRPASYRTASVWQSRAYHVVRRNS